MWGGMRVETVLPYLICWYWGLDLTSEIARAATAMMAKLSLLIIKRQISGQQTGADCEYWDREYSYR